MSEQKQSPLFQEQLFFLPLRTRDFDSDRVELSALKERTTWQVNLPLVLWHLVSAVLALLGIYFWPYLQGYFGGFPEKLQELIPLLPALLVLILAFHRIYYKLRNYALPYQGKLGALGRKTLIQSDFFFVLRLLLSPIALLVGPYYWIRIFSFPLWIGVCIFFAVVLMIQYSLTFLPWEIILYLVFGGLTTVLSVISFTIFDQFLNATHPQTGSWDWVMPKVGSFILAILFAYVTNRRYVFRSQAPILPELLHFVLARVGASLILEGGGLYLLVNVLAMDKQAANILVAVLVVVVNYFWSKCSVFGRTTHVVV